MAAPSEKMESRVAHVTWLYDFILLADPNGVDSAPDNQGFFYDFMFDTDVLR